MRAERNGTPGEDGLPVHLYLADEGLQLAAGHALRSDFDRNAGLIPGIAKYGEIRCYIRDPDGYIIEVGQSTN